MYLNKKKLKLWNEWNFVENEVEEVQHVLKTE